MKSTLTVEARHGRTAPLREIKATIGKRYLVSPMNPQKQKHRGRTCVIESLHGDSMERRATVRFDNNNRLGKVDIADLVPATWRSVLAGVNAARADDQTELAAMREPKS